MGLRPGSPKVGRPTGYQATQRARKDNKRQDEIVLNGDPGLEQQLRTKLVRCEEPLPRERAVLEDLNDQVSEPVSFKQWLAENSATVLEMIDGIARERHSGSVPRSPPGTDEPGEDQEPRSAIARPVPRRNPAEGNASCTAFGGKHLDGVQPEQPRLLQDDVLPVTVEYPEGTILLSDGEFVETEIEVALDSGCCEHVLDIVDAPGYINSILPSPGSRRGQQFVVGNGQRIANEGQVEISMATLDSDPRFVKSVFQVAEVTRPLISVSRIADRGYDCIFGEHEARAVHRQTGAVACKFLRDGGLYVAKFKLKKPEPFGRQDP